MWRFFIIFLLAGFIVHLLYRNQEASPENNNAENGGWNDSGDLGNDAGNNSSRNKKSEVKQQKQTIPSKVRKPRGVIVEPNEYTSGYSIAYYDVHESDSDYTYLASQGYQGGGPSWEGIIYGLLKIKDLDLLSRIEFDAEGDGLVINANNRVDLEKIAWWIDDVKADRKLMQRAIMMANIDGRME